MATSPKKHRDSTAVRIDRDGYTRSDSLPDDVRAVSGDPCWIAGEYCFDGYIDGSGQPLPTADEAQIQIEAGALFPFIETIDKPCHWRLMQSSEPATDSASTRLNADRVDNESEPDPLDFLFPKEQDNQDD